MSGVNPRVRTVSGIARPRVTCDALPPASGGKVACCILYCLSLRQTQEHHRPQRQQRPIRILWREPRRRLKKKRWLQPAGTAIRLQRKRHLRHRQPGPRHAHPITMSLTGQSASSGRIHCPSRGGAIRPVMVFQDDALGNCTQVVVDYIHHRHYGGLALRKTN
jgi:hypothetical protein